MNSRRSSPALSEADADALLSGRQLVEHEDLREIIGLMRTASAVPAPTPTPALAALLHNGFDPLPLDSAQSPNRWARWSVRIAVVTAAAMTATLGAATANALPAHVQTVVADVVGAVTPLQLPRPAARDVSGSNDTGGTGERPRGGQNPDSETDEPSAERDEDASTTPATAPPRPKAPAVAPPQRSRATAPTTDVGESEPDTDEPDTDEPESDESEVDERDDDAPEGDGEEPERREADAGSDDASASEEADAVGAGADQDEVEADD